MTVEMKVWKSSEDHLLYLNQHLVLNSTLKQMVDYLHFFFFLRFFFSLWQPNTHCKTFLGLGNIFIWLKTLIVVLHEIIHFIKLYYNIQCCDVFPSETEY